MASTSEDSSGHLSEQQMLSGLLRRLHEAPDKKEQISDPDLAMETALYAMASIWTWIDSRTVLAAVSGVRRERLAEWEEELEAGEAYLAALREAVSREL